MRICILEADTNSDSALQEHGDMATQFKTWLSPALSEAEWNSIAVHNGASLPDPTNFDGYIITGSRHGVYDNLPWMAPLTDYIRDLRARHISVAGICFGHQIMAHAYGARVEKSDRGWVIGTETYDGKSAYAWHQDQVLEVPQGAADVKPGKNCPIARLSYDFPALSVQYHPEFSKEFMSTLLDMYDNSDVPQVHIETARAELDAPLHRRDVAQDFAEFFRTHKK